MSRVQQTPFVPAQAGIQGGMTRASIVISWVPAYAGTSGRT